MKPRAVPALVALTIIAIPSGVASGQSFLGGAAISPVRLITPPAAPQPARRFRRLEPFLIQPLAFDEVIACDETVNVPRLNVSIPAGAPLIHYELRLVDEPAVDQADLIQPDMFCGVAGEGRKRTKVCLRDIDEDGRLDQASGGQVDMLIAVLFEKISPVSCHPIATERVGRAGEISLYAIPAQGKLRVGIQFKTGTPPGQESQWGISDDVVLQAADLPATVELLGSKVRVLAFDKGSATIETAYGFPAGPVLMSPLDPADLRKGFHLSRPK